MALNERFGFWAGTGFCKRWQRGKDCIAVLPVELHRPLQRQIEKVSRLYRKDLCEETGELFLPVALDRKYPIAGKAFECQYLFPAKKRFIDSISMKVRRDHIMKNGLQKAGKHSSQVAAISNRGVTHTLRHSFATHMPEHGINIHALQGFMGHADVKTTEIHTHAMRRDLKRPTSPLDRIIEDHATQ